MSIITLTTDYGTKDHFVGVIKGKLFVENPDAKIIDITHDIDCFNTAEASYIIGCAYKNFPKGTVHIIGVDIEKNIENQHIALLFDDHYFICADNGILSMLIKDKKVQKIISINIHEHLINNPTDIDAFIKVACHLSKGGRLHEVGNEITEIKEITEIPVAVSVDLKSIQGSIIYFDHFGNVVTNITKKIFEEVCNNRNFEISINNKPKEIIRKVYNKYSEIALNKSFDIKNYDGIKVAIFNENGFLEIGIFKSISKNVNSAKSLFGLNYRDVVIIEFK
jgi:S-adenosylmethionine hydrolase